MQICNRRNEESKRKLVDRREKEEQEYRHKSGHYMNHTI